MPGSLYFLHYRLRGESAKTVFFEEVVINPGPYQEQINELKVPDHLCAAFDLQESEVRPWSRFTQMEKEQA